MSRDDLLTSRLASSPLAYMRKHLRETKIISVLKSHSELSKILAPLTVGDNERHDDYIRKPSSVLSSLRIDGINYTTAAVKNRKGISRNSRILFLDLNGERVAGQIQSIRGGEVPIITVRRYRRHCNEGLDPFRLTTCGFMWTVVNELEIELEHIPPSRILTHIGYLPMDSLFDFSSQRSCAVIVDLSPSAEWFVPKRA